MVGWGIRKLLNSRFGVQEATGLINGVIYAGMVNWFRAKSRYDRMVEEEKQLRYEMRFAANYFAHQSEMWVRLMQESTDRDQMGHRAYDAQQAFLYLALARDAERLCQWVEQVAHVL
ncbi:hypothetical protein AcW1_003398 [Taiwanofungus camphoratus]|nr:hypothetical protein AcW1_003398 [Antrodia cinnamomea]